MKNIFLFVLCTILFACEQAPKETANLLDYDPNPAAPEFNMAGSDSTAIAIADQVMEAMGGREAWDSLRFVSWNFFGRRDLTWDKLKGNVRIESPGDSLTYLVNIFDKTGKAFKDGVEIIDETEKKNRIDRGYSIWVNDSYWLFMPFKLKDSGVTLTYAGEGTTQAGVDSEILQMTFEGVGVTPQNKYQVWVDKSDKLIKQWAFYRDAAQDSASAIWPWDNYKSLSGLKLSFNRSDDRGPKDVKIPTELPETYFTEY